VRRCVPLGLLLHPAAFSHMYLLYLDDSGSVQNASDRHIVLAGLAVFERQTYWLSNSLDNLAAKAWPENPSSLEFRGTDIRGGKKHWRGIEKEDRLSFYRDAMSILSASRQVHIFAAAVHKAALSPNDPMEFAFEQICNRFDRFLGRLHNNGNTQRGLIILDKSTYETSLQQLAIDFKTVGHRWGLTRNLSDVPLFVDSKATRMIQYADMVAHAVRRYYEQGDSSLFDIFSNRIDSVGGVLHGLTHYTPIGERCDCLACRRK